MPLLSVHRNGSTEWSAERPCPPAIPAPGCPIGSLGRALTVLVAAGVASLASAGAGAASVAYETNSAALPIGDARTVRVAWGEASLVCVATKPEPWGMFQFPRLKVSPAGEWFAKWSMLPDSITSYGKTDAGHAVSRDEGKTWTVAPDESEPLLGGLLLPNGDRLVISTPRPVKTSELKLPPPVGSAAENYGKAPRDFYRLDQLPAELQVVHLKRLRPGAKQWTPETATIDDPGALRYTLRDLFPIVWWGDLRLAADGSIVAGVYPGFYLRPDGRAETRTAISFFRSADGGRSWKIAGRIHYQPNAGSDPKAEQRDGYTEPAFEILRDGTYLCIFRTTDGAGIGPMYASRSRDEGKTWSQPEAITPNGVLPRLLRLDNGTLVLAAGRPGLQLRFAAADAARWSDPIELVPPSPAKEHASCGYSDLVAIGRDTFVLIYSDFRHVTATGDLRKAIKVRRFTVRPQ